MSDSKPVKNRRSMADAVREHVRDGITNGLYRPGERLRETEIGDLLSVSRTPIREAVKMLEAEGLVRIEPWNGCTVTKPTTTQIFEFYKFRETLEGLAAELAASVISDEALDRLAVMLNQEVQQSDQGLKQLARENESFHRIIFESTRNQFLALSYDELETTRILLQGSLTQAYEGRRKLDNAEHQELLNALRARDPQRARQAAMVHVRNSALSQMSMIVEGELSA